MRWWGVMTTSTSVLLLRRCDSAELYAVGLSLAGVQAQVAADASHMRSCLAGGPPQAIVADFIAGWDPGWELLRELRGRADTCDTPAVLIVSDLTGPIRARAEELGYAALLTKPCLPDALAGALRSALQ
jgi:DNA-binding response OmpR family regulator